MIYSKDRVSRETLAALITYSMEAECQFLIGIKPPTNIINDWEIKPGSVIRFLKVEEKVFKIGDKDHHRAFSVKIMVEDEYLVWLDEKMKTFKEVPVPSQVLNRVAEILNV